jgi:hypothetical protein
MIARILDEARAERQVANRRCSRDEETEHDQHLGRRA